MKQAIGLKTNILAHFFDFNVSKTTPLSGNLFGLLAATIGFPSQPYTAIYSIRGSIEKVDGVENVILRCFGFSTAPRMSATLAVNEKQTVSGT